ncbi:class D sortase [Peribacillus deserti]|uniref:Class D sortase n=1 Tax=Peribacillus deserti TaxID=673318 RepID=A0A2N5M9S1_9BACI|nr:class D sortase [Peribacillus deserti]PLT31108.1 class D sortase [Peribacillus deserti]
MKKKKKRRSKKWRWVLLGVPISIILLGLGIIAYFGLDLTKQTVMLARAATTEHKPDLPQKKFEQAWPELPAPGESLGELTFPSLKLNVPVVQGTHDEELKKGAGHFAGSALPGQGGQVLLSGHRDTVFTKLEHLKKGDKVTFTTKYGDFVYEATSFKIVPADDQTVNVAKNYETLTLSTCYPFDFIGDAPDRYIIYTKLVSMPDIEVAKK